MKTLNEVIRNLEIETTTFDRVPVESLTDALDYLKEYRELTEELVERNEPLSWNELKQMFHKPVWIETKTKKGWVIINDFEAVTPNSEHVNVIHTSHKGAKCSHFAKHLMGQTWNAYREERP